MCNPKKHLSCDSLIAGLRAFLSDIEDPRQDSKVRYALADVGLSAFACMFFQDPSMLAFQKRMQDKRERSNFNRIFQVETIPESTQLRDVIDQVPSESIKPFFGEVFKRLQRGKHLEQFQHFRGKYLVSIDGTQYFTSQKISCNHCLTKKKNSDTTYSHQALQAALVCPGMKQAIPLMAEDIGNRDGKGKQDCEINAAKRLIPALRQQHPQLDMILLGDSLFSKHTLIEAAKSKRMDFILTAKPGDHKHMFSWIADHGELPEFRQEQEKCQEYVYSWINNVPLGAKKDAYDVNFLQLEIYRTNKDTGEKKRTFRCSWVTNLALCQNNVARIAEAGRCRWKIENECFNNLKNQGYCLEHNFGHGNSHLAFNVYLLTLLAFLFHQVFELTDKLYIEARSRWSLRMLWERIRGLARWLLFDSWHQLMAHCLDPPEIASPVKK